MRNLHALLHQMYDMTALVYIGTPGQDVALDVALTAATRPFPQGPSELATTVTRTVTTAAPTATILRNMMSMTSSYDRC